MSLFTRCAVALGGAALAVTAVVVAPAASAEPVVNDSAAPLSVITNLSLVNGWSNYGFGTRTAGVVKTDGVVNLRGAISTSGTNALAFRLPAAYRPSANVYVYVDLCNATNGRLLIQPDGNTFVQAAVWSNAQCFTSLEGASFPYATSGYTVLTASNGWTGAVFGTRNPAAKVTNGIVNLKGAIGTSGSSSVPFTLPAAFRPKTTVYAKVDMCNATNGRLIIQPTGTVIVDAESDFANAQCFTSLEGVSYPVNAATSSWTAIPTINGWTAGNFSTRPVAGRLIDGIIHLAGSISTTGSTSSSPFTLPAQLRPSATTYLPVDMCGATNGRIIVGTSGIVSVQAETDSTNAACFTSLEGVVFKKA